MQEELTDKTRLERCITHWKENSGAKSRSNVTIGPLYCALCLKYNVVYLKVNCDGCPIAAKTGQVACGGTPYSSVTFAIYHDTFDAVIEACKKELKFLEDLYEELYGK